MPEIELELETETEAGTGTASEKTAEAEAEEITGGAREKRTDDGNGDGADDGSQPGSDSESESTTESEPERPRWQPVVARWRLPIAIGTVLLEAGVLLRLGPHWTMLPVLAFAATAVVLAVIDFAILRLPNALTGPTALAVVAAAVAQALADHDHHILLTELEGALGVGLFYAVLHLLSRGGLGLGDVKLGAVAGLVLASRGWMNVFNGTLLAYVITLVIALVMLTRGRKRYPYGPGLIAGAVVVLLVAG